MGGKRRRLSPLEQTMLHEYVMRVAPMMIAEGDASVKSLMYRIAADESVTFSPSDHAVRTCLKDRGFWDDFCVRRTKAAASKTAEVEETGDSGENIDADEMMSPDEFRMRECEVAVAECKDDIIAALALQKRSHDAMEHRINDTSRRLSSLTVQVERMQKNLDACNESIDCLFAMCHEMERQRNDVVKPVKPPSRLFDDTQAYQSPAMADMNGDRNGVDTPRQE